MELKEYRNKIANLTIDEQILRNLYLRNLAIGKVQGPNTGYASIDKPWLKYYEEDAITRYQKIETIYECIYSNNKEHLNDIVINYYGNKITYADFFKQIDNASANFLKLGVKKGEVVAVCMPSTPEALICIYALNKIGAIPNMLDPRYNEKSLEELINECNSKHLVYIDLCEEKLNKIIGNTKIEKMISLPVDYSFPKITKALYNFKNRKMSKMEKVKNEIKLEWYDFINGNFSTNDNDEVYEEIPDLAVIIHSSGSTGKPKSILLSNNNINSIIFQYNDTKIPFERGQSILSIIPPFSSYGLCSSIHMAISSGVTSILIPKFNPDDFDKLIMKYKPNHVLGVPSFYDKLTTSKRIKHKDLSFLKDPAVGGDNMLPVVERKINQFFLEHNNPNKLIKGYGMSEMSSSSCTCMGDINPITSVGIPLSKTEIAIFDQTSDSELEYGKMGEINISGPGLFIGYLNNDNLNKKTKIIRDGKEFIKTGDLGYMTEDGFLYHSGRIKRMIVRYDGYKIYPSKLENILLENPCVQECAIVCANIPNIGNMPVACISLNNGYDYDMARDSINLTINDKFTEREVPYDINFYDTLPKTSFGKLDVEKMKDDCQAKYTTEYVKKKN